MMITPTPLQSLAILELCSVARTTYERGWNAGTAGNFSVRGSDHLWMSPSGVCKGLMHEDSFVPIHLESLRNEYPWIKPSDETALHATIYRHHPQARVVVHVHPPALVKLSLAREKITFSGHEMQKALGQQTHDAILELWMMANTQDIEGLARSIVFPKNPVSHLVLKGHGVYAWAAEAQRALAIVEALEFLCHQG